MVPMGGFGVAPGAEATFPFRNRVAAITRAAVTVEIVATCAFNPFTPL